MSYSRWMNSRFYTYWTGINDVKEEQVFKVQETGPGLSFTYRELVEDLNNCLLQVRNYYNTEHSGKILEGWDNGEPVYRDIAIEPNPVSIRELEELKGYMKEFVKDMDKEYNH